MKFYLAAKFTRREEMEKKALELIRRGADHSCRWVFGGEDGLSHADIAMLDLHDIEEADTFILFSHPRGQVNTNGRMVECGYAFALGLRMIVIGPRENIFLYHPDFEVYDTWEEFLKENF